MLRCSVINRWSGRGEPEIARSGLEPFGGPD
jgi:hypothetical protein